MPAWALVKIAHISKSFVRAQTAASATAASCRDVPRPIPRGGQFAVLKLSIRYCAIGHPWRLTPH
jgi:hypothetical protein